MQGEKLRLLKKLLEYVVGKLSECDRMALISFADNAQLVCSLTSAGESRMLVESINALKANGSTNIKAGLELAYQLLKK